MEALGMGAMRPAWVAAAGCPPARVGDVSTSLLRGLGTLFVVTLQAGKWSPGRFNAMGVPRVNHTPYDRALCFVPETPPMKHHPPRTLVT